MDGLIDGAALHIRIAYQYDDAFCGRIYRPESRLWLWDDLASVVVLAAHYAQARRGIGLLLYDGLRTVEAQKAMNDSPAVKAHPHWTQGEDRVVSPPGVGAHPRGMAIDLTLCDKNGVPLPMGTAFDEMPEAGSGPESNRAHRDFHDLPQDIEENRQFLTGVMMDAAAAMDVPLLPLSVEWWDFRLPPAISNQYAPLSETGLSQMMQMVVNPPRTDLPDPSESDLRARLDRVRRIAKKAADG